MLSRSAWSSASETTELLLGTGATAGSHPDHKLQTVSPSFNLKGSFRRRSDFHGGELRKRVSGDVVISKGANLGREADGFVCRPRFSDFLLSDTI